MINLGELFSLKGEVAMITGGNSGIGKAMTEGLAAAGADIAIAALDEGKTSKVLKAIKENYEIKAIGVRMDVASEASVQTGVKQAVDKLGKVSILVNNAGTNIRNSPQDYSVEEWDNIMNVNLRGAFLCSKAIYPIMKANNGGKIINTGSMTSILGQPRSMVYACSKSGILSLTYSLGLAWVNDNIRVNAILPGWIDTALTANIKSTFPSVERFIKERVPMGRWGKPADCVGAVIFLASHASDFVTAEYIRVDGGFAQGTNNMEPYNQYMT